MGMVRSAALEFAGDGIRVNGIAPGVIRSAQTLDPVNSLGEEGLAAFAETVPLGRVGNPEILLMWRSFCCLIRRVT